MKKSYFYLGGALVAAVCAVMFFVIGDTFVAEDATKDIHMETYIRNITWDTSYQLETPYNKGEKIEKVFVFKNQGSEPVTIRLNKAALAGNLENSKITIDNATGAVGGINIEPEQAALISVEGITLQSSETFSREEPQTSQSTELKSFIEVLPNIPVDNSKISGSADRTASGVSQDVTSLPIESEFKILRVSGDNFYSNTDNALRIDVTDASRVTSVIIGEKTFTPVKSSTGTILVNIEKGTILSGKYFLALMLTGEKLMPAKDEIVFLKPEKNISISNITPTKLKNDIARFIVIQGVNLKDIVSVQLSNNIILTRTDFVPINNQVIGVKIPDHLVPGVYHLSIMDLKNIYEFSEKTFQIY